MPRPGAFTAALASVAGRSAGPQELRFGCHGPLTTGLATGAERWSGKAKQSWRVVSTAAPSSQEWTLFGPLMGAQQPPAGQAHPDPARLFRDAER